jgi:hypothetical protein
MTPTMVQRDIDRMVSRLSAAAARRLVEPDTDVLGSVSEGQLLPDRLLTIAGLDLDLDPAQRATISREEIASITQAGIRFEAVLEAGFAAHIATARDLADPRITFILHEIGEETRHQRLFQRLLTQLHPKATQPLPFRLLRFGYRAAIEVTIGNPALFYALVLAGEEIPDLFQKLASEDPSTDPFMFDSMVHPGVYKTVGLPALKTWRAANRTAARRRLRFDSTRPILKLMVDAGALRADRLPLAWRKLAGVTRGGDPTAIAG